MSSPDRRDQPIVSQEELDRHDREFEEANPNWNEQHGGAQ